MLSSQLIKILFFKANNAESSTSYSRNNLFFWLYHPHKQSLGWSKQRGDLAGTLPGQNHSQILNRIMWEELVELPVVSNHELKIQQRVDFALSPIPVLPYTGFSSFSSLKKGLCHPNSAQPKAGTAPPSPQEEHSLSHWGFLLCTTNKTSRNTGGVINCCQSPRQTGKTISKPH